MSDVETTLPFGQALAELLRENDYTTQTGNVNWHAFARELNGVHYETLRKAVVGERAVTRHVIEECARVLRVRPDYFVEWRMMDAAAAFDVRQVGFDKALANLQAWVDTQTRDKPKRRGASRPRKLRTT